MNSAHAFSHSLVMAELTLRVRTRIADPLLLAGSAVVVGGGFALFAAARSELAELFAAMAVLGFGVGGFSAAMPGVILAVTPKSETSSAMSFNYVVRSVGYSLGSAIGGLILAAGTGPGHLFPTTEDPTILVSLVRLLVWRGSWVLVLVVGG
ncbi:MFS transporter [Actinopolymorpha singaporensis]|uniref:MFS transporter n=1 Tax=Actinopolymorpha singaporensis TaxID=117157 RepID=UPI0018D2C2EE|nr:MFS transporter [Actinopolymorpha singaporensis]